MRRRTPPSAHEPSARRAPTASRTIRWASPTISSRRGSLGEHRRRPRPDLLASRQVRQVHAGQDVGGAVMSTAEPFTQVRQVRRPGKGLSQSGADTLGVEGCCEIGRGPFDHLSAEPLLVAQHCRGGRPSGPTRRRSPGQRLQNVVGRVDLPPAEALAHAALIGVVVVVPALAHGEEGEQPVVAGVVAGHVALAAVHMGERVDAEGGVIDRDRAPEEADDQARPAADQEAETRKDDRRARARTGAATSVPGYRAKSPTFAEVG